VPLVLGFIVLVAVVWGGIRMFSSNSPVQPPTANATKDAVPEAPAVAPAPGSTVPSAAANAPRGSTVGPMPNGAVRPPVSSAAGKKKASARTARSSIPPADGAISGVHEVIPDVPQRARRTIRGTVRVSVRVIVEKDGTVFAALADQRGPSRYFERLAVDAAKKWTFPPADATAQRLMLVKFEFTRDGTAARAVALKS
jgi:TonB family protein